MNPARKIISAVTMAMAFAFATAGTPSWVIPPKYEKLSRYCNDMYTFEQNGKWGLVRSGGKEILSATCDFITPYTNGYALAGVKNGNRYQLKYILDEDGTAYAITETYYLPPAYQYVSDGKLAVVGKSGKYGYISYDGAPVIKCQFDLALPFKEGWAPVKQGNYVKYISENYDRNPSRHTLTVDFHYGEMTMGSCFSDGQAAVAYNSDFALIGTNGQKIRKLRLNDKEFLQLYKKNNSAPAATATGFDETSLYSVVNSNGRYGLKDGDKTVVMPQFDAFPAQYSDGTVLTVSNGRYGLLKISAGDVSLSSPSATVEVDRNDHVSPVTVSYSAPATSKLFIDTGDGNFRDYSDRLSGSSGSGSVSVTPLIAGNAESCSVRGYIENNGIRLAEFEKSFNVEYPVKLRVSAPGPASIRANAQDICSFSATIYNDSRKPVTVSYSWSTGGGNTVTVPAHGSKTVGSSVTVKSEFAKTIRITLDSGESAQREIHFISYF